jgi:hypothetical protein
MHEWMDRWHMVRIPDVYSNAGRQTNRMEILRMICLVWSLSRAWSAFQTYRFPGSWREEKERKTRGIPEPYRDTLGKVLHCVFI